MLQMRLLVMMLALTSMPAVAQIPTGNDLQRKAEANTRMIDTTELKQLIDEAPDLVLIDIRTDSEIKRHGGSIDVPQNIQITRGWLEFNVQSKVTSADAPVVVYCGGGLRSPLAAETLQDMGYTNVWNYAAGYFGWIKASTDN